MNIKKDWSGKKLYSLHFTADHYHVFVGDLDSEIHDEYLHKAFAAFGTVT